MDIYQWNKKYSEISNRYNALYRNVAAHFGFSDCQFKILYNLYINRSGTTQNKLAYGAKDDKSLRYYFKNGRRFALIGGLCIFAL